MPIQITNPLHLYRAIFRETTYLFDQNVRSWTQTYARSSFRKHAAGIRHGKHYKTLPYDPDCVPSLHERHLLKRGRKFQRLLERANQGYQRYLRSVLEMTYGRKGRRRVTLTTSLMRPCSPDASGVKSEGEGEQSREHATHALPVKYSRDWKPSAEFMSILNSQIQLGSWLSIRKQMKLKPGIDEKNRWGKPMPLSRVRNKTRKWYAKVAANVMPPLPEEEWERLKAIALRRQEFRIIPRRPKAREISESKGTEEAEFAAKVVLSGYDKPLLRLQANSMNNPHRLTPRFLSRLYARSILNHASVAVPDPNGRGLISKWDNGKRDVVAAEKPKSIAQVEALFG